MFGAIRKETSEEYAQPHDKPWIVGFSGGKDSTLVAHLVVEHLLSIPRSDRTRTVHIAANDTLVESPLAIGHIGEGLAGISGASIAFGLPIVVATTTPGTGQTFQVNSPMGCETACTRPLTRADGRPWSVIPEKAGMTDFPGACSRFDRGNDGSSDLCNNRVYGLIIGRIL